MKATAEAVVHQGVLEHLLQSVEDVHLLDFNLLGGHGFNYGFIGHGKCVGRSPRVLCRNQGQGDHKKVRWGITHTLKEKKVSCPGARFLTRE